MEVGKVLPDWLCATPLAYANESKPPTTSTLRVPSYIYIQCFLCPEGLDIVCYMFRQV